MKSETITYNRLKKLKTKKDKKVVALMISIIVLIIVCLTIYATTDVFKTPKMLFYKYLIQGNLSQVTDQSYDEFVEQLYAHDTYDVSGTIKHHIEDPSIEDKSIIDLADGIVTNYEIRVDEHDRYVNLRSTYKDKEIINFELVDNDSKIGIKEKDFNTNYVMMDLSKLDETLEKLGINATDINDINKVHPCEIFDISKDVRKDIASKYIKHINTIIPRNDYTKKKNVEIEIQNKTYKCNVYTLKITGEELRTLYLRILEELKQDDLTLDLIVEKYNLLDTYKKDITKEEIRAVLDDLINKTEARGPDFGELEINIYENNSKTLRTEIKKDKINNTDTICIDVLKDKTNATVLVNINKDNKESEILIAREKLDEDEEKYKIIFTKENTKFILDMINETHKGVEVNIPHFNENNSINISEAPEDKIDRAIQLIEEMYNHTVDRFSVVGFPKEALQEFVRERVSKIEIGNEN